MTKINSIMIADGIGKLTPKKGPLTLKDFSNNTQIYESYLMMMRWAKEMDKNQYELEIREHQTEKNDEST